MIVQSRRRICLLIGLLALVGVTATWRAWQAGRIRADRDRRQCGHWCLYRSCALLGIPFNLSAAEQILPFRRRGHSMLAIADALERIGVKAHGKRTNLNGLSDADFPCIAHLREPDHFIVLIGASGDRFHAFDNDGERTTLSREVLLPRWSGAVLCVSRHAPSDPSDKAGSPSGPDGPRAWYDTLHVDSGEVAPGKEIVSFSYSFQNVGNDPLVLSGIKTTCTCVKAEYPTAPVAPGESATIKLHYRPGTTTAGAFAYRAAVTSNDRQHPVVVLNATGFVEPSSQLFPRRLDLGDVVLGQPREIHCVVWLAEADRAFAVRDIACSSLSGLQVDRNREPQSHLTIPDWWSTVRTVDCSAAECQSYRLHPLRISCIPQGQSPGSFSDTLHLSADLAQGTLDLSVPVRGRFVRPVLVRPSKAYMGEVVADQNYRVTVSVVPRSDVAYRICRVRVPTPGITCRFPRDVTEEATKIAILAEGRALLAAWQVTLEIDVKLESSETAFILPLSLYASPAGGAPVAAIAP